MYVLILFGAMPAPACPQLKSGAGLRRGVSGPNGDHMRSIAKDGMDARRFQGDDEYRR
jgi:hypothetical protein